MNKLIRGKLMKDITIYVLTHKKFDSPDDDIYIPLLNGSALQVEDFGYLRDDTGENISNLNEYYAELTGQYWAWKNSTTEIIGFCHYRRYFAKNILLKILNYDDIKKILSTHDIILPNSIRMGMTHKKEIEISYKDNNTGPKIEEYSKLRKIIEEYHPEYLNEYDQVLNDKEGYFFNMFICKKELADDYFEWLFDILDKIKDEIDYSQYPEGQKRVLGYFSERLINVYIKKHNLKIKEKPLLFIDRKFPIIHTIGYKIPIVYILFKEYVKCRNKLIKK